MTPQTEAQTIALLEASLAALKKEKTHDEILTTLLTALNKGTS